MTVTAFTASLDGVIMPASRAAIPATDEGLLRGDGIFEVIRLYEGVPFALEEHLRRLCSSAASMRLEIDVEAVRAEVLSLLEAVTEGELVRIVLTRGGHRLILTEALPEAPERIRLGSITYSPTRVLDAVKSLSYGANMLASRLARERGFDEALLVTPHGRVLEAPTSSIFWIKDGHILTPPLEDHILASITRGLVLEVTGAEERGCALEELLRADEAFLASTTREVQPVTQVDDRCFETDALTSRIAAEVSARIRSELAGA